MLDAFFNRAGDNLLSVLSAAYDEAARQKIHQIGTEHLLLAVAGRSDDIAGRALGLMKIDAGVTKIEVDQYCLERTLPPTDANLGARYAKPVLKRICSMRSKDLSNADPHLSDLAVRALLRAEDYARFLGNQSIECSHLLLAISDLQDASALKIFERLSANLIFLRKQIIHLLAQDLATKTQAMSLKSAVTSGLKELVDKHESCLELLDDLSKMSRTPIKPLPKRKDILHMVCMVYLEDFLYMQVLLQRYLLEEMLSLLANRIGNLDEAMSAEIVETGAKNVKTQVQDLIEYLWSHEYRAIAEMPHEADCDVVSTVIEDLWWTQSEEISLDKSYTTALQDHRKPQILSLQERRLEVNQRLDKLKGRLGDTIHQTFEKPSLSA